MRKQRDHMQVQLTAKCTEETNFSWTKQLLKEENESRFARLTIQRLEPQVSEWAWSEPLLEKVDEFYRPFLVMATKEVKRLPKSNQKKFIRLMQQVSVAALPFIIGMSLPTAQAATVNVTSLFPYLSKGNAPDILPPEILEILVQVIAACGIIGLALATLCLMIAGMYRMFGQVQKAHSWSVDVVKGLGQILLAPIIVLILVMLVNIMFSNVPGFSVFW